MVESRNGMTLWKFSIDMLVITKAKGSSLVQDDDLITRGVFSENEIPTNLMDFMVSTMFDDFRTNLY